MPTISSNPERFSFRFLGAVLGAFLGVAGVGASSVFAAEPLHFSDDERMVVELLVQNDIRDFVAGSPTFHFERAVKDRFGDAMIVKVDDVVRTVLDNPFRADREYEGKIMILPKLTIERILKDVSGAATIRSDRGVAVSLHFDETVEVMEEVAALHRKEQKNFVCKGLPAENEEVHFGSCRDFDVWLRKESDVMRMRFSEPQTDADWLLAYTVLKFTANLRPEEVSFCRDSVTRGAAFSQEDVDLILSRNGGLFDVTNVESRFAEVGFDVSKIESLVKRGKALSESNRPETRT